MFRIVLNSVYRSATSIMPRNTPILGNVLQKSNFSCFNNNSNTIFKTLPTVKENTSFKCLPATLTPSLIAPSSLLQQPVRTVTKFSLNKGKRKTVKAVLKRFKRLDWGAWIRTRCGRHKKMFKKSAAHKRRLRQHIFTNAAQSYLLDKMVTAYWRRPKYYIDDPYAPYHKRDEFFATKSKSFKV